MRKGVKILIIILSILIVFTIAGIIAFQVINKNLEHLNSITIEDVNLSMVDDGIYRGEYQVFPIHVIVDVDIVNHEIVDVTIVKHDNGQGQLAEEIVDDVIDHQSLDVDAIASATYSSIVILLAISDALS